MPNIESTKNWKMIGAVVLLLGALIFVYAQYRGTQPPDPDDVRSGRNRMASEFRRQEQMSQEERQQHRAQRQAGIREEMFQQMNMTQEQRAQFEALPHLNRDSGQEERLARQQAISEILTPEQMEQMREIRQQRQQRSQRETDSRPYHRNPPEEDSPNQLESNAR